jgi:hypothetical protein
VRWPGWLGRRCLSSKLFIPALQDDINAVSKSADAIKKKLAELDRHNEQVGLAAEGAEHEVPQQAVCLPSVAGRAAGLTHSAAGKGQSSRVPRCGLAAPAASAAGPQTQGVRARQQQRAHAHRHHGRAQEEAQGLDGRVPGPEVGHQRGQDVQEAMPAGARVGGGGAFHGRGSLSGKTWRQLPLASLRTLHHPAALLLLLPPQVARAGRVSGGRGAACVHGCATACVCTACDSPRPLQQLLRAACRPCCPTLTHAAPGRLLGLQSRASTPTRRRLSR